MAYQQQYRRITCSYDLFSEKFRDFKLRAQKVTVDLPNVLEHLRSCQSSPEGWAGQVDVVSQL